MNFITEDERIILEDYLNDISCTLTIPADPHSPSFSKECSIGKRRDHFGPNFLTSSAHALYYFSDGTATVIEMVSSPSAFFRIFRLAKR